MMRTRLWKIQTQTFIKEIFGHESPEFKEISDFNFAELGTLHNAPEVNSRRREEMCQFLDNCVQIVEKVGTHKKEWKHIILTWNPGIFWTLYISLLGFVFYFGGQINGNKSNETSNQQTTYKNDSTHKK